MKLDSSLTVLFTLLPLCFIWLGLRRFVFMCQKKGVINKPVAVIGLIRNCVMAVLRENIDHYTLNMEFFLNVVLLSAS